LWNLKTAESLDSAIDSPDPIDVTRQFASLVWAEYMEMPGLSVTLHQAQRSWGVGERTCRRVLDALIARGILRRTAKGRYVRAST